MSHSDFGLRKISNGSTLPAAGQQHQVLHSLMAIKNSPYRKGFSTFDDSDGNNADNDSVNSVMSSGLQGESFNALHTFSTVLLILFTIISLGFSGQSRQLQYGTETDSVSTLNGATINQASKKSKCKCFETCNIILQLLLLRQLRIVWFQTVWHDFFRQCSEVKTLNYKIGRLPTGLFAGRRGIYSLLRSKELCISLCFLDAKFNQISTDLPIKEYFPRNKEKCLN